MIQDYVSNNFTEHLKNIYVNYKDSDTILIKLGKCYVSYFTNNPHFYSLFFSQMLPHNT